MTQATDLARPFDQALLGDDGSGHTVVPVAEVVGRLNNVLGVGGWSYEVVSCRRDDLESEWWVAHVRLSAVVDGTPVVRDGVGGADTNRKRNDKTAFAVDNDVKSAVSSALKKAAWHLGVGTYLSRNDAAIRHEQQPPTPQVDFTDLEAAIAEARAAGVEFDEDAARAFAANSQDHAVNAAKALRDKIPTGQEQLV